MQPLISVIVPIYNVEKFLDICIQSIVEQTYENLEIILIDDGSPDNSPYLCDKWSKSDKRITIVHQNNSGVSSARNTGIKHAKGEFITFVDGDDFLEKDALDKSLCKIIETGSQLCQWGYSIIKEDKKIGGPDIYYRTSSKDKLYAATISYRQDEFQLGTYFRAVWGKLFVTSIIKDNNILFDKDLYIGEDAVFLLEYLKYVDTFCAVNFAGYNYRKLDLSAVHRYKTDLLNQNLKQLRKIESFLEEIKIENIKDICTAMASFVWGNFNNLIHNGSLISRKEKVSFSKKTEDAKEWYKYISKWRKNKGVQTSQMRKIIKFEYLANKVCPGTYFILIIAVIYNSFKYKK